MFRNFNKLIPCSNIIKNNAEEIIKQIPISERWECRDFIVKEKKYPVSSSDSYALIVPNDKQYDKQYDIEKKTEN
tara:strand:+ start:211 stop:435 length:225 start_codon:yes stop_codon:yes gene_type:complete